MPCPDYIEYHKTVTAELRAIKDRLKQLIDHRVTLGEFKEAALRAVLRRHLPANLRIGRGFIVTQGACSRQLDLLIVDQSKPLLFQDGDLLVVTPDAVRAVIEVKTTLDSEASLRVALLHLAETDGYFTGVPIRPWLGLYIYESNLTDAAVLTCLVEAASDAGRAVNCVTYGEDRFFRFWRGGELDRNEVDEATACRFRSYDLQGLAPSYFMGNLLDHVSSLPSAFAWYPLHEGKHVHMTGERIAFADGEPDHR